jgi:hypothetical protein
MFEAPRQIQSAATRRKVAADRTGATDEVARIAAVNELSTANGPINIIQPNAPPATTNT